jgi:hypothetical protein
MMFLLYGAIGMLCATLSDRILRRLRAELGERCISAALCLFLWPLWAPIALTRKTTEPKHSLAPELEEAREALDDAKVTVRGTPLEALLNEDIAHAILGELAQLVTRRDELRRLARRAVGSKGGDRDGPARLEALAGRDDERIRELVELVGALRTRLVLARYSGASIEGVGDLLTELTTRVESLDELFCPTLCAPYGASSRAVRSDAEPIRPEPARANLGLPL